jgi:hypothetical protein
LNVLLARWLVPQDYGAFTVAFAVFLLIGTFHTALLTEPMLVFGPSRYEGRFSEYLGALLYGHLSFTALSSLLPMSGFGFGKVYETMRELTSWLSERDSLLRVTIHRSTQPLAAAERTDIQVLAQAGLGKKERDGLSSLRLHHSADPVGSVSVGTILHVKELCNVKKLYKEAYYS